MSEWLTFLLQALIGIGTAILAARFSAGWALKRFQKERWWERKEKAYIEIIDSLSDLMAYAEYCSERYMHSTTVSPPEKLSEKYQEARWKIEKATIIGALAISEKVAQALTELQNRPRLDPNNEPLFEVFGDDWNHYKRTLDIIRECARQELHK